MASSLSLIISSSCFKMRDVSLFLSLEHLEAIVWLLISPNFSILVSQEIEKLEGRERKRDGWSVVEFTILYRHG